MAGNAAIRGVPMETQTIVVAIIAALIIVGAVLLMRWMERPDEDKEGGPKS